MKCSAEDTSEAEDSDKAKLPNQLEYDVTGQDQCDDNMSESESDADDLRHDSSSVDDATETAATSVARSDGLDEAAIQDQGVKPGDLIAESKAPVEETETVEEKEPLNQDVEEDDSDAASEVSEVSTIVPTKSDDSKPSGQQIFQNINLPTTNLPTPLLDGLSRLSSPLPPSARFTSPPAVHLCQLWRSHSGPSPRCIG